MLNVRSVTPTHLEDKTAEARIRDAALARFTRDGFAGTTVRAIADDAAVSPALVLHHFGSKEGLRRACDAHVVERVRTVKSEAITEGRLGEPATMTAGFQMAEPLMRYLAWTLSTGSEAAADLFDDMVDESVRLFQLGVEHGSFEPSPDPRARAAVMLAMQLGGLVMHDHLERALGTDPLGPEGIMRFSRATLELFSGAMFAPGQAAEMLQALDDAIENMRKEPTDG
jgi:TetR/AcrR family transcriptional regulator, regulator of cefoperazone and chloramphenicol sensitivity